jgi:hypothetical protein
MYQFNHLCTLHLCQINIRLLYFKTTLILKVSSVITISITVKHTETDTHKHAIRNVQLLIHEVTFL